MRPALPALTLVLLVFLCTSPAVTADALIANGDFEQPAQSADAPFTGWTFYRWSGSTQAALDHEARPGGGAAAHLHAPIAGKAALHQRIHLAPGRYRLAALTAAADLRPGKDNLTARLHLELGSGRQAVANLGQGNRDWTPVDLVFQVDQALDATLYCFLYGTGDLWLDALRLDRLGADDATPVGMQLGQVIAPLRFDPPITRTDLLLTGYCAAPDQAQRPHCRRLSKADPTGMAPTRPLEPRSIADFSPPRSVGDRPGPLDLSPRNGLPTDWSGYDYLDIQIHNPGRAILEGLIEIRDTQSKNYWSRVNWYTHFPPGDQQLRIPLALFVGEKSVIRERRRLDTTAISRLFVSVVGAGEVAVSRVRLTAEPPYRHDFPQLLKLDAGTDVSPVMAGFSPLTAALGYRPDRGYGFDAAVRIPKSEDRRHPDNLLRDWISIASGGLRFDLPNGDYGVWLMLEDPGYWEYVQNYDRRTVLAEGKSVYNEQMTADGLLARIFAHQTTEDLPGDDIWARYIKSRYRPIQFQVQINDGQLNLDFSAGSAKTFTNTLSALLIWPLAEDRQAHAFIDEVWERLREQYRIEYSEDLIDTAPRTAAPLPPASGPIPELHVFQRHWDQDVQPLERPRPNEFSGPLTLSLARGEQEPLTLELHAVSDLTLTAAELRLPGLSADAYKVRSKLTRATDDGARYVNAPRLLDPLELPLRLSAGQTRRLWFSVSPDADTPPGAYAGELRLTVDGGRQLSLPVQATVWPFVLPTANLPFGYLGSVPVYTESAFPQALAAKRRADIGPAFDLVRRQGMTQFSGGIGGVLPTRGAAGLNIDFSSLDTVLEQARRFPFPPHSYGGLAPRGLGFERYRVTDTQRGFGAPYAEVLDRVLGATRAHLRGLGWPEPIYSVGDEPTGDAAGFTAALADAVRAAGSQSSVFTSLTDEKSPALALVGRVDHLFLTLHNAWGFERILQAGGQCGTYNLSGRYARGLYQYRLRRLGCRSGYFQFAFNATHVDPYYALDGREDDFAAALPTRQPGVLIPTLDLFRFGEAIDDYRYLLALERAIAGAGETRAAQRAARWLDDLMDEVKIDHRALMPPPLDDQALDQVRAQAAAFIDAIQQPGH